MTILSFHKMHGLGNDFILINGFQHKNILNQSLITALADRHRGIGFDQLLLIETSKQADVDCLIFNADGSEAEQCGNGMRCVARFVHEEKIINQKRLTINTKAGIVSVEINDYDKIRVNMGVPKLSAVPMNIPIASIAIELTSISLGNPHAIYQGKINTIPVAEWGALLSKNNAFPQGINVGFMEVLNRKHIFLRTYERGVGETLACGSNACAAVAAGIARGYLDDIVTVKLPCGNLQVEWQGQHHPIFLTGPASRVFSGGLALD